MRDESQELSALDNVDCMVHLSKILELVLVPNSAKFSQNNIRKFQKKKERKAPQVSDQILQSTLKGLKERKKEK